MNLKENIGQLHIEIKIELLSKKGENKEEKLISIVENLKLSVLKSILTNVRSSQILYDLLHKIPIVELRSDKYGFIITVKRDSITINILNRIHDLEHLEELRGNRGKVDLSVLKYVDQIITALFAAISSNVNKPVTPSKYLIGVVFYLNTDEIQKLVNDIVSIKLPNHSEKINTSGVVFSLSNKKLDSSNEVKIDIRGSNFIFEEKFSSNEIISISDEVEKVISKASLFFTEKRILV